MSGDHNAAWLDGEALASVAMARADRVAAPARGRRREGVSMSADPIDPWIDGEAVFADARDRLFADPDALLRGLAECFDRDGRAFAPSSRLRGYLRSAQKIIELAQAKKP